LYECRGDGSKKWSFLVPTESFYHKAHAEVNGGQVTGFRYAFEPNAKTGLTTQSPARLPHFIQTTHIFRKHWKTDYGKTEKLDRW
jgi:hypothetical protein